MTSTNPYLEGNFAPVREEVTELAVPVTGSIPDYLDGRYLRNGPNPVGEPDPGTYHWFMGSGMVHGLRIRDGRVEWYRNRYVRSRDVAEALGEPRRPGPLHAGFDFSPNTHVIGHAGRTFAIVEGGGRPYELGEDLSTIGPCDFDGTLPGGYTAHPLVDPGTGEMHAVSYFFGWDRRVQYSVLDRSGRIRRTVDIEVTGSPMMHAFSLTERYVVIYDLPVTFDLGKVGKAELPYSWDDDYPARVGVLPRDGDARDVRWFEVEPCYVFHPFNAHDEGGRIVVDLTRHPRTFATEHRGPNEGPPTFDRWTIDLVGAEIVEERVDDRGQEFPRVDERRTGRPHRFAYAVSVEDSAPGEAALSRSVIRHDLSRGTTQTRSFGEGREVDEFVFVPSGPQAAEGEGLLMGFVYDGSEERSDLVILDAATLETVAAAHLPVRVPHGFHGSWVPSVPSPAAPLDHPGTEGAPVRGSC